MRKVIEFIKDENNPTDDELLLQLAFGLGRHLSNPKEERHGFVTQEGIHNNNIRHLMKLLIERCGLPVPSSRVDEWIHWYQNLPTKERLTNLEK